MIIDGNADGGTGDYQFYNYDDSVYEVWNPGQPDWIGSENCVQINTFLSNMNNIQCSYQRAALCEKNCEFKNFTFYLVFDLYSRSNNVNIRFLHFQSQKLCYIFSYHLRRGKKYCYLRPSITKFDNFYGSDML